MATRRGSAMPFAMAQSVASIRSSCILPAHSRLAALTNRLPKPVEPRKFTLSTA
jgi:hypothetical protein